MFPFRKKKEEEDEVNVAPIKKTRKRKKKEEIKPWGKLERTVVFIFLVAAPLLSILFFIRSKNSKVARPLSFDTQILGDTASVPGSIEDLKQELINETQNLQGTYGIWVQAVDNSYSTGVNENSEFDGASLFKLPLMIGYFEAVDEGKVDPLTTYILKVSDAMSGSGDLANMPAGSAVTYNDMIQALGKNSDNTAFQIMSNVLDENTQTDVINKIGMLNTDLESSITTPQDIGLLFYKVSNSSLISSTSRNKFYEYLTDTDFEKLIPGSLPGNVKVAHKYAAADTELNDAGIVYTKKPYILVILSKDINPDEANTEIPKISKIVYDWAH